MNQNILGFYADTKMLEQEKVFRHFFCSLSKERQQKIEAIKVSGGRRSTLGAWTLMDHGLRQLYGLREREITIAYGAHGKPYVQDRTEIHFNLSHSGDYVLAAFGPVELGCDIQMIGEAHRNDRIAARFFTEAEQKVLAEGMDFYRIWARKESYIKCIGEGMARDLRSFDVVEEGELVQRTEGNANVCLPAPSESQNLQGVNIYFAEHTLSDYAMAVCYACTKEIKITWIEENLKY